MCRECEYNKNYLGVTFYAYAPSNLQIKINSTLHNKYGARRKKNPNLNIRENYLYTRVNGNC